MCHRKTDFGIGAITTARKKYVGTRAAKAAGKKIKLKNRLIVWACVVLVCTMGLLLGVGALLQHGSRIYPNVSVGGIDLGGMKRDAAQETLEKFAEETYGTQIMEFSLPDSTLRLLPAQTGAGLDAEAAVDAAMAYGREHGPIGAVFGWFRCKRAPHSVDIADALTLNEDYLHTVAADAVRGMETELKQSEVSFDEETHTLTVQVGTSRRVADEDALVDAIVEAYGTGKFTGAAYEYELTPFEKVDLQSYFEKYGTEMKDASYDEATFTMTPEVLGFGFDVEEEQAKLDAAEEGSTFTIEFAELVPDVTVDTLKKDIFPDVLATYSSPHTNIPNRTNNLILACEQINNTVLNPGEVFSFNKTVGERTADRGFKAATVYLGGGESAAELGGGVCQVASTIYLCALMADLEIVERTEHMYAVTYVPMGMDATVYWGVLDFKFRNSTEKPMLMEASVSDGKNHITLLGTKPNDETVKMTYTILSTTPWEEVEEVDETKEPDYKEVTVTPYTGYTVQTYKERYDKDGNLLSTDKEAFSKYRKRDRVTTVGPKEVPPEEVPVTDVPAETPATPAETPAVPAETPAAPVETPAPAPAETPVSET